VFNDLLIKWIVPILRNWVTENDIVWKGIDAALDAFEKFAESTATVVDDLACRILRMAQADPEVKAMVDDIVDWIFSLVDDAKVSMSEFDAACPTLQTKSDALADKLALPRESVKAFIDDLAKELAA
jgi:hypothetical protein